MLAGAFGLAAVFVTLRGGAGPLRAVMDAADRVADGDYAVRVREAGPPPMRALAHAFNAMTGRLAQADRQRRDLMADVAHELRTPLSVLQGRLEGLLDGVYPRDDRQLAALLEETQVLSRLIDDLRTLRGRIDRFYKGEASRGSGLGLTSPGGWWWPRREIRAASRPGGDDREFTLPARGIP